MPNPEADDFKGDVYVLTRIQNGKIVTRVCATADQAENSLIPEHRYEELKITHQQIEKFRMIASFWNPGQPLKHDGFEFVEPQCGNCTRWKPDSLTPNDNAGKCQRFHKTMRRIECCDDHDLKEPDED